MQFYNGKDPVLYEMVVNVIEKNKVSGYLSTPKTGAKTGGGAITTDFCSCRRRKGDAYRVPRSVCLGWITSLLLCCLLRWSSLLLFLLLS